MVQEIILHGGVDIVKVGIGPGSACTTRLKTGVGYPQLSAIIECAHAAHGLRNGDGRLGLICADGGCRTPADVAKAFAAGADFVMLGGMLAGTDECEGEWATNKSGDKCLRFYGMSSHNAQYKYGGIRNYTASEGRSIDIPYKGPVESVLQDILGGIRSSCAYIGATKLKDMSKCAEFVLVNRTHFDQRT
jgi:GMP reductase